MQTVDNMASSLTASTFLEFINKNHPKLTEFFDLYGEFLKTVKKWEGDEYPILSLAEEAHEFQAATRLVKLFRGDTNKLDAALVNKELGDVFFFWFFNANSFGSHPLTVIRDNVIKIQDRANRNVIQGNGDNR